MPWGSLRTFGIALGVVGLIRARPGCPRIHSCPLGRECPGGDGVRSCAPLRSSGSFMLIAYPGGRRVHSGSLGSFVRALVVGGFIRVRCVRSGAPWVSSSSFGFIRGLPGGRRVHSGSLGSFRRGLGVVGFINVRWVHSGAHWRSSVYSGSFGSFWHDLIHSGAHWRSSGSLGLVGFIRARPRGPSVHSGAPCPRERPNEPNEPQWGSLGSFIQS